MKFYKLIMLIATLLLSIIVCACQPILHKPFVLEKEGFQIANAYQEPGETQTMKLFRLGDAPVEERKLIAKAEPEAAPIKRQVHIEPSEFYQIANRKKSPVQRPADYQYQKPQAENLTMNNPDVADDLEEDMGEVISRKDSFKSRMLQRKEETIAWNKWRSDIQNSVMVDSSISAPLGTLFMFSFKVDNKRRVSNIKVLCSNPFYQQEASENITAVIKSYEGNDILKFPKKTKRKSVKFDGSFMIWITTEFASPENFSDFERIQYYE